MAGGQQYYDKVSEDEGSIDLDQPAREPTVVKRWSWGQQSLLIRTIVIACYTILIAAVCSAVVEFRHEKDDANTVAPVVTVTATATAAAAAVATPEVPTQKTPSTGLEEIQHCGGNYTEARELGCVYDVMMQLWMPKDCYDEKLSESFLADGNWTWWADIDADRIMSDEEMHLGEHSVAFMLQDYHKSHCIYTHELLVRALRNQWMVIPELVSYDHVLHCKEKVLTRPDGAVRGVRAPTGFTSCAPYDIWKQQLPEDHASSIDAPKHHKDG